MEYQRKLLGCPVETVDVNGFFNQLAPHNGGSIFTSSLPTNISLYLYKPSINNSLLFNEAGANCYWHWTPGIKQHVGFTSWVNSTKFLTGNHKSDRVFLVSKSCKCQRQRKPSIFLTEGPSTTTVYGYFRIWIPTPYQNRKSMEVVPHFLRSLEVVVVRFITSMLAKHSRNSKFNSLPLNSYGAPKRKLVFQTPLLQVLNSLLNFWGVPAYPETLYDVSCRHKTGDGSRLWECHLTILLPPSIIVVCGSLAKPSCDDVMTNQSTGPCTPHVPNSYGKKGLNQTLWGKKGTGWKFCLNSVRPYWGL